MQKRSSHCKLHLQYIFLINSYLEKKINHFKKKFKQNAVVYSLPIQQSLIYFLVMELVWDVT